MPQPTRPGIHQHRSPIELAKRQELFAPLGLLTATWSRIEDAMGEMLVVIARDQAPEIANAYNDLLNGRPQDDFILKVAAERLSDDQRLQVDGLVGTHSRLRAIRNNLIHSVWTISPSHPDCLISQSPKARLADYAEYSSTLGPEGVPDMITTWFSEAMKWSRRDLIYTRADFDEIFGWFVMHYLNVRLVGSRMRDWINSARPDLPPGTPDIAPRPQRQSHRETKVPKSTAMRDGRPVNWPGNRGGGGQGKPAKTKADD